MIFLLAPLNTLILKVQHHIDKLVSVTERVVISLKHRQVVICALICCAFDPGCHRTSHTAGQRSKTSDTITGSVIPQRHLIGICERVTPCHQCLQISPYDEKNLL